MPRIQKVDEFIERSQALLLARPETTRITTTYSHKRAGQGDTANSGSRPAIFHVKTYDPVSGTCYRLRGSRTNQLSRVLSALGPRGVTVTKGQKGDNTEVRGFANIMANVDIEYSKTD
uniref:ARAD1B23364p n=1 Tax=Blastobotrys adeninivorans TaxID=409370 RepID=A0A060T6Y6_BLAAD